MRTAVALDASPVKVLRSLRGRSSGLALPTRRSFTSRSATPREGFGALPPRMPSGPRAIPASCLASRSSRPRSTRQAASCAASSPTALGSMSCRRERRRMTIRRTGS